MTPNDNSLLEEAIKNGYIYDTKATKRAERAYDHWCEINQRPNIVIRPKVKYSTVRVDFVCIHRSKGYSDAATEKIRKLLLEKYQSSISKREGYCAVGGIYSYIDIEKEIAPSLASDLFKIALEDMQREANTNDQGT
jgi:hypothetical protein